MGTTLRHFLLILLALFSFVWMPAAAIAQTTTPPSLRCLAGVPEPGTMLFPATAPTATATGQFACANADPAAITRHIFSWVTCQLILILNTVLGKTYCGMQQALKDVLSIVFTVYIMFFGVQILMGTTQLNVKEIMIRLLKIAGVWMFVSESLWGIEIVFSFFLGFIAQTIYYIILTLPTGVVPPDAPSTVASFMAVLDDLFFTRTIGLLDEANSSVFGIFAVLAAVLPPVFGLGLWWLWMNFIILVEAVKSFLLGISAIAFLITLGPIFLSFMLFKSTYQFFENWVKYMISYSLQIVVVFAVTAMWLSLTSIFIDFFDEVSNVVFPYKALEAGMNTATDSVDTWGLCPLAPMVVFTDGPFIECQDSGFDPWPNDYPQNQCSLSPAACDNIAEQAELDQALTIPASKIPKISDFIYYVVYHLLSLIIVAYAFSVLMEEAPSIAKKLAGPEYIPILGQGWGFNRYGQFKGASAGQSRKERSADEGAGSSWPILRHLKPLTDQVGATSSTLMKQISDQIRIRR